MKIIDRSPTEIVIRFSKRELGLLALTIVDHRDILRRWITKTDIIKDQTRFCTALLKKLDSKKE